MNTSDAGLRFLMKYEGWRNRMYDDGGPGRGNATIGIGHLIHEGPIDGDPSEAPFVNGLTDEQVFALLKSDIPKYEAVVNTYCHVKLNQNQFDAMVDFCFNTGGGYPAVWALINNGQDPQPVLEQTAITPLWAQKALKARRRAEADLYDTPVVEEEEDMKPFLVWDKDRQRLYLVGPQGATWITRSDDGDALAAAFGKVGVALSQEVVMALGGK